VVRKQQGLFLKADSFGDAEVVVESRLHNDTIWSLSETALHDVLRAYRERAIAIGTLPNVSIVMVFRNHGPRAGTSLEHPHSQIIASPIIPPHVRDPFQKAALHFDTYGTCVYCSIIEEELRQRERVIFRNAHFVALCPFASRTPYEVRIYPLRHMAGYTWISDVEIPSFAEVLRFVTRRVHDALGNPSYNFIIRSAPIGDEDVRYLHWYFVLIPKISTPAGFEMGSGIYINQTSPEDCAHVLRSGESI
jgi:UDPglucose--hexose-1-phosphate uridylyltransferase